MKRILATLLTAIILLATIAPIAPITPIALANAPTTPSGLPLSEMEEAIEALVAEYMADFAPGTAIVIVHDGEVVFSRGFGYADLARGIPVNADTTVFEYGSTSKLFVYVLAMQLAEQKLLDLDADIHDVLPADFADALNFRYTFTIRDLMNHSAGFGENVFYLFRDAETDFRQVSLREALVRMQPRQIYTPGTFSSYSNFGAAFLAYVVSHVAGQDYTDLERERILAPLGMTNVMNQGDWFGNSAFMANHARGHAPAGNGEFNETIISYISIYPTGSLRGTALDLAQFAIALMPEAGQPGPLFQSRETLDRLLSPTFSVPTVQSQALSPPARRSVTYHGFLFSDSASFALGHDGGTVGFNSAFVFVPDERFAVVVQSNADGGIWFNEKVIDLLIGGNLDAEIISPTGLPDARNIAGSFSGLRRNAGFAHPVFNLVMGTHFSVDALDKNTIALSFAFAPEPLIFRQIAPYTFRRLPTEQVPDRLLTEITFVIENGNVAGFHTLGIPADATTATFGQTATFFFGTAIILVLSVLFFLIAPIVLLISFLRSRKKKPARIPFHRAGNLFLLSGTLLSLNTLIASLHLMFGAVTQSFSSSPINPHVWANYIFALALGVTFIWSILLIKRDKLSRKRYVLFALTALFAVLLILIMVTWGFFIPVRG